ncbi:MAG: hypothetical protein B7Z66_04015 [Chromatiales bacterium 21-64-14]|nr:MAG: hypothetical protein B7Z66_04015 [Chromatiales bacterium 21-64-14]HQU14755.1 SAP domain-containing protein [Gammaproteobacteria bacterium]
MKMQELRAIAQVWGLSAPGADRITLVRAIQRAEGNFDCFATAHDGVCDQLQCLWRADCFRQAARDSAAA